MDSEGDGVFIECKVEPEQVGYEPIPVTVFSKEATPPNTLATVDGQGNGTRKSSRRSTQVKKDYAALDKFGRTSLSPKRQSPKAPRTSSNPDFKTRQNSGVINTSIPMSAMNYIEADLELIKGGSRKSPNCTVTSQELLPEIKDEIIDAPMLESPESQAAALPLESGGENSKQPFDVNDAAEVLVSMKKSPVREIQRRSASPESDESGNSTKLNGTWSRPEPLGAKTSQVCKNLKYILPDSITLTPITDEEWVSIKKFHVPLRQCNPPPTQAAEPQTTTIEPTVCSPEPKVPPKKQARVVQMRKKRNELLPLFYQCGFKMRCKEPICGRLAVDMGTIQKHFRARHYKRFIAKIANRTMQNKKEPRRSGSNSSGTNYRGYSWLIDHEYARRAPEKKADYQEEEIQEKITIALRLSKSFDMSTNLPEIQPHLEYINAQVDSDRINIVTVVPIRQNKDGEHSECKCRRTYGDIEGKNVFWCKNCSWKKQCERFEY